MFFQNSDVRLLKKCNNIWTNWYWAEYAQHCQTQTATQQVNVGILGTVYDLFPGFFEPFEIHKNSE